MLEGEEEGRPRKEEEEEDVKRKKKGETIKESSLTKPTEDGSATLLSLPLYRHHTAH